MATGRSAIEWTEATWNPVTGCSKVSPGCAHCYAETLSLPFRWTTRPWTPSERTTENIQPPSVNVWISRFAGGSHGGRSSLNSMSDLFHELVPLEFILI